MKILFVSGNLSDGGAQRVISVVASGLAEKGHDVNLLLFSRNEKEYPINEKVKITAIGRNFAEYSKLSGYARTMFIRKYLKELKPQVAVGFLEGGYGLFMASIGMRFPKVASARIDPAILLRKKGSRAILDRIWFRAADAVVLQTNRQKQHAKDTGWKNQTVIANPVSDNALATEPHFYDRPCRRIVMAGRLEKQKNYPMAFAAMERIREQYPDATLDVFGKGSQEAELQNMIAEKGLQNNIFLRGWTQNTVKEYEQSDIYVMCSDFEGMPNALMEAMAAGLPCVSTDCDTGPEDLITDGESGYLVPVGDAEALTARVLRIMDMPLQERKMMGEKAKQVMAAEFDKGTITGQWEALLHRLVDGRKAVR